MSDSSGTRSRYCIPKAISYTLTSEFPFSLPLLCNPLPCLSTPLPPSLSLSHSLSYPLFLPLSLFSLFIHFCPLRLPLSPPGFYLSLRFIFFFSFLFVSVPVSPVFPILSFLSLFSLTLLLHFPHLSSFSLSSLYHTYLSITLHCLLYIPLFSPFPSIVTLTRSLLHLSSHSLLSPFSTTVSSSDLLSRVSPPPLVLFSNRYSSLLIDFDLLADIELGGGGRRGRGGEGSVYMRRCV